MDFYDITAIICEFNPFHFGHRYLISKAKEKSDTIVCIMSGNFVQRGELAFADRYSRAKAAVRCGADIVLSLPFPYCMMSARDFAFSGVYIAEMLNIPSLTFGAESDVSLLDSLSTLFCEKKFEDKINETLQNDQNTSYAKARQSYVEQSIGKEAASALDLPNNILALEYMAAIKKNGYKIKPQIIKRDPAFLSSSDIRKSADYLNLVPEESASVLKSASLLNKDSFSAYATATLRQSKFEGKYYEAYGGLDKRIIKAAENCNTLDELYDKCVSASFTRSKCRRAVLSMIFDVMYDYPKKPKYTQLLCANKKGVEFLSRCKKNSVLPIVSKPSSALDSRFAKEFLREMKAENTTGIFYSSPLRHPLTRTPEIL